VNSSRVLLVLASLSLLGCESVSEYQDPDDIRSSETETYTVCGQPVRVTIGWTGRGKGVYTLHDEAGRQLGPRYASSWNSWGRTLLLAGWYKTLAPGPVYVIDMETGEELATDSQRMLELGEGSLLYGSKRRCAESEVRYVTASGTAWVFGKQTLPDEVEEPSHMAWRDDAGRERICVIVPTRSGARIQGEGPEALAELEGPCHARIFPGHGEGAGAGLVCVTYREGERVFSEVRDLLGAVRLSRRELRLVRAAPLGESSVWLFEDPQGRTQLFDGDMQPICPPLEAPPLNLESGHDFPWVWLTPHPERAGSYVLLDPVSLRFDLQLEVRPLWVQHAPGEGSLYAGWLTYRITTPKYHYAGPPPETWEPPTSIRGLFVRDLKDPQSRWGLLGGRGQVLAPAEWTDVQVVPARYTERPDMIFHSATLYLVQGSGGGWHVINEEGQAIEAAGRFYSAAAVQRELPKVRLAMKKDQEHRRTRGLARKHTVPAARRVLAGERDALHAFAYEIYVDSFDELTPEEKGVIRDALVFARSQRWHTGHIYLADSLATAARGLGTEVPEGPALAKHYEDLRESLVKRAASDAKARKEQRKREAMASGIQPSASTWSGGSSSSGAQRSVPAFSPGSGASFRRETAAFNYQQERLQHWIDSISR